MNRLRSDSELTSSFDEFDRHVDNEHLEIEEESEGKEGNENQEIALLEDTSFENQYGNESSTYEVDDDITTILNEIEENDPAKQMASGMRSLMKKIVARYAAKIERKNRMILAKTVATPAISLKNIVDQVTATKKLGTISESKDEGADSGVDFMTLMLQKKMSSMQKQVELAEQKARSSTLQWIADKKKYKELLDQQKREIEELTQKLTILDRKLRLQEQLSRDPNMIKLENAIEEEINEIQQLRDSHGALENEVTEKRQMIASLSTELSDTKIELAANAIKLDYLNNKLEELLRNEDVAQTQIEKMTKEMEEQSNRIFHLEDDNKELNRILDNEKANYFKLKSSIDEIHQQYEQTIEKSKRQYEESQAALQRAIDEKDYIIIETNSKINRVTQENRQLIIEREQLLRDQANLIRALQFTARTTKSILQELDLHDKKTNKSLEDYLRQTKSMHEEITKLHSNISEVLESSERKLKEAEEKFLTKQQQLLKSIEESNQAMKFLQLQVEQKEKERLQLEVENTKLESSLMESKQLLQKLEYELYEERNSEKEISPEELERIRAEERTIWQERLREARDESLQQLQAVKEELEQRTTENAELQAQLRDSEEQLEKQQESQSAGSSSLPHHYPDGFMINAEIQTMSSDEENENVSATRTMSGEDYVDNSGIPDLNLSQIEKILRNALLTNNYYFSKESKGFTNSYPIEESFLQDLVRSFHQIGKELKNVLLKTKEFQPSGEEISQETEKFIGMLSQDLLIKLDKSKEETIVKVKNDAKDEMTEKVEATIKQLNEAKQSELFEQKEAFQKEIQQLKLQHEAEINELLDEIELLREEYEQEVAPQKSQPLQTTIQLTAAETSESSKKISVVGVGLSGNRASSIHDANFASPTALTGRQNSTSSVNSASTVTSRVRPTLLSGLSRKGTMRSTFKSSRFDHSESFDFDSLPDTERSAVKDRLRAELEAEIRDKILTEVNETKKITDQVLVEDNTEAMMNDLMKSLPPQYQNKDLQSMRQELLTGELMNIGIVQNENFDRLRNKNFGPDSLIGLTILEHHARYESGDGTSGETVNIRQSAMSLGGSMSMSGSFAEDPHQQQQRQHRMQMKALEIKRKLLTQQIVGEVSILDLLSYLHATEEHLALLSSLNAWKSLLYYQTGGIFRDVLEVHRDSIKLCINAAGGMQAAVQAVTLLRPTTKTNQWPDNFRLKALEIFRLQLIRETQKQKQSISEMLSSFSLSGTEAMSQEAEEKILQALTPEQRTLFQQKRLSLQPDKLKNLTASIQDSDGENSAGNNSTIASKTIDHSSDRPDSASSSDQSLSSALPVPMTRRKSEFMFKPGDLRMRRSNTWRMKSERGFASIPSSSREDLAQIAENANLIKTLESNDSTGTENSSLAYEKHRTLHGRVDEIVFAAMRGEEAERTLLMKLLDAFYNWEQNQNITANSLFQNCLGFNAEVDVVVTALVKSSLNSEIPLLMIELYEKIRNFMDYYAFKESIESDEKLKSVSGDQERRTTAAGIVIADETRKTHRAVSRYSKSGKTSYDCGTQTNLLEDGVKQSSSFEGRVMTQSTSTTGQQQIPIGFRLGLLQDNEFEVAPGIYIASIKRLILTIKSQDPKLNKWKSVTAAAAGFRQAQKFGNSHSGQIVGAGNVAPAQGSFLLSSKHRNKPVEVLLQELAEIPDHVRYCFGPAITPFTHTTSEMATITLPPPLHRAPHLLELLHIKDCIPIVFPSVFPLAQGINMITGYKYHEQGNDYLFSKLTTMEGKNSTKELITFPRDVILLQIAEGLDLPRGLYPIEFSNQLTYDASLFFTQRKVLETTQSTFSPNEEGEQVAKEWNEIKLPPGHELVQMVNCCIDFPVGVEVSNGVRIAPVPANVILPANIKIVQKYKRTLLPDFMLPLKHVESKPFEYSLTASNLMLAANSLEDTENDVIPMQIRQNDGICVIAKPKGVYFQLGQEIVRRPIGHQLPPGMKLVPKVDHPQGLQLPKGCELVQLIPKYDLPPTCRLSSSWHFYSRPPGVYLQPNQYLVYPDPSLEDHMIPPLPGYACQIALPNLPYGIKLPNRAICVELLLSRLTQFALPEGAIIAPGITVLNPKFLHGWQLGVSKCPINILLVKRTPGTSLPPTVERGSRSDLPSGVLLGENMDVLKISTRFELPAGVKIDIGVTLGQYVQLAPGTQLLSSMVSSSQNYLSSLTVVEWPYGITLNPGIELVRRPPAGCFLPFEYQQVTSPYLSSGAASAAANTTKLPEDCIMIKLPRAIKTASTLELSEQVTVGLESMIDFSRPLLEGMIFASRTSRHAIWPAEMKIVSHAALSPKLLQVLELANQDNSIESFEIPKGPGTADAGPALANLKKKQRLNVEIVQLCPRFDLPGGVHLHPDVVTVTKPFYLQLPPSVVLVRINRVDQRDRILLELATRNMYQVELATEHILPLNYLIANSNKLASMDINPASKELTTTAASVDAVERSNNNNVGNEIPRINTSSGPTVAPAEWFLDQFTPTNQPDSCLMYLQLPDVYDVYSWGENLPGVEAVSWNESNHNIALPPGHFLIERPRQFQQIELPSGFSLGVREEFKHLRVITKSGLFPPQVEIMHLIPSFHLPLGIHIINTSVIGKNTFNNNTGTTLFGLQGNSYTKKLFDPFWISQFAPFERISKDAVIIPWPRDLTKHLLSIISQIDPQFFYEPYALVWMMKNVTKQEQEILDISHYPSNLVKHPYSDDIITELFKSHDKDPAVQMLLQYIRRISVLGRFQDTPSANAAYAGGVGGSIRRSNAAMANAMLKMQQVLHVVRISNGFPLLNDRYEKLTTKAAHPSAVQNSPKTDKSTGADGNDANFNQISTEEGLLSDEIRLAHQKDRKITIYPKLSRIERIKVMNISEEIKKFLEQLLIFRFYSNATKEELKEKMEYLQFDLMESTLWKALSTNQELEKNNEKLAVQNDKLDKENHRVLELLTVQQQQLDEFKQKLTHEDDLKAIISKLKEQLTKKDQEINELVTQQNQLSAQSYFSQSSQSASVEEIQERHEKQVNVLTSQIADYEGKIQGLRQQLQSQQDSLFTLQQTQQQNLIPRIDYERFQKITENALQNILLLINSFIIQFVAQIDAQIFSQISQDYGIIDLFQELLTTSNKDIPLPIQAFASYFPSSNLSLGGNSVYSLEEGGFNAQISSNSLAGDDNSSVISENSLFSKLVTNVAPSVSANYQTQQGGGVGGGKLLPTSSTQSLSSSTQSIATDLKKDGKGKKLTISADFPLDVNGLYHHRPDEQKKEYISFAKPLLVSKSLDTLPATKGPGASPSVGNPPSMEYGSFARSLELFLGLKEQRQTMLFNDSTLFAESNADSMNPPSPSNPFNPSNMTPGSNEAPQRRRMQKAEMELLQWKSDIENHLLSTNTLFQETLQQIITSNKLLAPSITSPARPRPEVNPVMNDDVDTARLDEGRQQREEEKSSVVSSKQPRQQSNQQGTQSSSLSDEINWSGIEVSLQIMTQKVITIFQSLLQKYQTNYHKLLLHIEQENQMLVKVIRQLRLHVNILKSNPPLPPPSNNNNNNNAGYDPAADLQQQQQQLIQSYKQKIYQLENKINDLQINQIHSELTPIQQSIQQLQQQTEMEKSLKFVILMIKQQIVQEQHYFQQLSTIPVSEELQLRQETEKELKAVKQNILRLKNHVKDYEERADLLKEEIISLSNLTLETIDKFHQQVHGILPAKLLGVLLNRGQQSYQKIQHSSYSRSSSPEREKNSLSPTSLVSNKTILSPIASAGVANFSSNMSVGSLGSVGSSVFSSTGVGSNPSDILTDISKSLLQASKPKGQSIIGSMPPAPSQSQFSNRQKHQNEHLAQVNKFFEHTYRKTKY